MNALHSATDTAKRLGISSSRLRILAANRGIGTKVGPRSWVFTDDDIERLRTRAPGKPGRPAKA